MCCWSCSNTQNGRVYPTPCRECMVAATMRHPLRPLHILVPVGEVTLFSNGQTPALLRFGPGDPPWSPVLHGAASAFALRRSTKMMRLVPGRPCPQATGRAAHAACPRRTSTSGTRRLTGAWRGARRSGPPGTQRDPDRTPRRPGRPVRRAMRSGARPACAPAPQPLHGALGPSLRAGDAQHRRHWDHPLARTGAASLVMLQSSAARIGDSPDGWEAALSC
jgi:hypothetical protein